MKVGDIVQSNFRGPRNVEGALGIVLEIKETLSAGRSVVFFIQRREKPAGLIPLT